MQRDIASRILILEAQALDLERRLDAIERQTVVIPPRYLDPPRLGAETYNPEFWDRMDAMG